MTPGGAYRVGVAGLRKANLLRSRLFLISLCLSALLGARLPSHPADFGVYLCVLAPRPPAAVSACGDRSMMIFPRRPARCAPETNPAVGRRAKSARLSIPEVDARASARLPRSLPHDHVHMPLFWHLTIIPSSLPRAGPFSSYKSPCCVLV